MSGRRLGNQTCVNWTLKSVYSRLSYLNFENYRKKKCQNNWQTCQKWVDKWWKKKSKMSKKLKNRVFRLEHSPGIDYSTLASQKSPTGIKLYFFQIWFFFAPTIGISVFFFAPTTSYIYIQSTLAVKKSLYAHVP